MKKALNYVFKQKYWHTFDRKHWKFLPQNIQSYNKTEKEDWKQVFKNFKVENFAMTCKSYKTGVGRVSSSGSGLEESESDT